MSAVEKDNGQYDTVAPVFWATGAALFIRRKDYLDAGGLDGRFFAHMEEIDLCWRADAGLCTPKYRLSCRRCNLEKGESS
jgi:GT2 family glycosyltransferase